MEAVDTSGPLDVEKTLHALASFLFGLLEGGIAGFGALFIELSRQIIADGVGDDEVAVGQTLHERRGAEAIRSVIGEVCLSQHMQAGNVAHEIVIHPQSSHRVVHRRVDAHRALVGVFAR